MTDITDFISAAIEDKPMKAHQAFADALTPRIDQALSDKYNEVAKNVFNPSDELEDNTETEMEDNDV